jgi:hypothetical protein
MLIARIYDKQLRPSKLTGDFFEASTSFKHLHDPAVGCNADSLFFLQGGLNCRRL